MKHKTLPRISAVAAVFILLSTSCVFATSAIERAYVAPKWDEAMLGIDLSDYLEKDQNQIQAFLEDNHIEYEILSETEWVFCESILGNDFEVRLGFTSANHIFAGYTKKILIPLQKSELLFDIATHMEDSIEKCYGYADYVQEGYEKLQADGERAHHVTKFWFFEHHQGIGVLIDYLPFERVYTLTIRRGRMMDLRRQTPFSDIHDDFMKAYEEW